MTAFVTKIYTGWGYLITGTEGADIIAGESNTINQINANGGNDTIYGGYNSTDYVSAGNGDDVVFCHLAGSYASVSLGAGNDTAYVGKNMDYVSAGDGNDYVYVLNNGTSYVYGEGGNDTLMGSFGADCFKGGDGNDYLDGSGGNDALYGDAGSDNIKGGAGNDILMGGMGRDTLNGGAGVDTIHGSLGDGSLYMVGQGDVIVFNKADTSFAPDIVRSFADGYDIIMLQGFGVTYQNFYGSVFTLNSGTGGTNIWVKDVSGINYSLVATLEGVQPYQIGVSDFMFA